MRLASVPLLAFACAHGPGPVASLRGGLGPGLPRPRPFSQRVKAVRDMRYIWLANS